MHHLYNTHAFVLNRVAQKEADMYVTLLTEKFGVIRVVASGLRYEKSKLRYALQKYAFAEVTLVRGKNNVWRLTTGMTKPDFIFSASDNKKQLVIARMFLLIEKVVTGEDADELFFEIVKQGVSKLSSCDDEALYEAIETLVVYRIMHQLGYVGKTEQSKQFTENNLLWSEDIITKMKNEQRKVAQEINDGLRESQLVR